MKAVSHASGTEPGGAGLVDTTVLLRASNHLGREMEGTIMSHDTAADQLVVNIAVSVT